MQKVAWPITIVQRPKPGWRAVTKNEFNAIPVMIPGSAIGSTTRNETAPRPKKRKRCTPTAAADPSTMAIAVEIAPAFSDSPRASRISVLSQAAENHFVEKLVTGQPCTFEALNA